MTPIGQGVPSFTAKWRIVVLDPFHAKPAEAPMCVRDTIASLLTNVHRENGAGRSRAKIILVKVARVWFWKMGFRYYELNYLRRYIPE